MKETEGKFGISGLWEEGASCVAAIPPFEHLRFLVHFGLS